MDTAVDRALWITWYDLPDTRMDEHLDWVYDAYIPRMLERPGVLWGAHYASEEKVERMGHRVVHWAKQDEVPDGYRYILLFGATDVAAFVNPTPGKFHDALPASDREMLAMRRGARSNIMIEEARVTGLAGTGELAPAPCIQLGSFNATSYEHEDDIAEWYACCRLPTVKALPGHVRTRKLVSVSGWAKHAALYEFTSLEARNKHFVRYEQPYPAVEAWSGRVVPHLVHAPNSSNVAQRMWPPI